MKREGKRRNTTNKVRRIFKGRRAAEAKPQNLDCDWDGKSHSEVVVIREERRETYRGNTPTLRRRKTAAPTEAPRVITTHNRLRKTPRARNGSFMLSTSKKDLNSLLLDPRAPISLSRALLEFSFVNANEDKKQEITICNNSTQKVKFNFEDSTNASWKLIVTPNSGTLKAVGKKKSTKKIIVTLRLLREQSMDERISVTANNTSIFLNVRGNLSVGVFGVSPSILEFSADENDLEVPSVLVKMKDYLVDNNALQAEGIFRIAGNAIDIQLIKDKMNKTGDFDMYDDTNEIHAIANLIKIWFRELPEPILNELSPEVIHNSSDMEACITAYGQLGSLERTLLSWLVTLLADVSLDREYNKMSPQNIAIVVAPNLYNPPSLDPMEGLVLSQKATTFLQNLIEFELEQRECDETDLETH